MRARARRVRFRSRKNLSDLPACLPHFMLITTVFTTIITFIYPDEAGYPDVAIFFAVVSGVCFVIAYSEQLFIGGDH